MKVDVTGLVVFCGCAILGGIALFLGQIDPEKLLIFLGGVLVRSPISPSSSERGDG